MQTHLDCVLKTQLLPGCDFVMDRFCIAPVSFFLSSLPGRDFVTDRSSNDKNNKVNLLIIDRQTKVFMVTLLFDLTLSVKGHVKCHIISPIGQNGHK